MAGFCVLVLGTGLQGRAAIQDLERAPAIERIIAADREVDAPNNYLRLIGASKTVCRRFDASDQSALRSAVSDPGVALVVNLLPVTFDAAVARAAIDARKHVVTTNYAHELDGLDEPAKRSGVTILPEAGFDPGIDLVLAAHAIASFDEVESLVSYGSGIPAPECRDSNVLNYKISWSFPGALRTYARPARLRIAGHETVVAPVDIFAPAWVHSVHVEGVGELEAFPNGDAVGVAESFGMPGSVQHTGRYTLRWPGHCEFWRRVSRLGLLDDRVSPDLGISPREFLRRHLEPQLQYGPEERDLAYLRVEVIGRRQGRREARRLELLDYRDLSTGMLAMNRLVGYPASVVAQFILAGTIQHRGVGRAGRHIPPAPFLAELSKKGIRFTEAEVDPSDCFVPARVSA